MAQTNSKSWKKIFFQKDSKTGVFSIWRFVFDCKEDYNSIKLSKSARFRIKT